MKEKLVPLQCAIHAILLREYVSVLFDNDDDNDQSDEK